ncbi:winged helix DNA-binding protein [Niallia sp. XMNu-256]|uniref:MarR family winged helix-turn-helix transcriptional regulator n=1 Tax=Niallia sp. XMNu-256 TaxID=3082444 RepID=UPI0030D020C3
MENNLEILLSGKHFKKLYEKKYFPIFKKYDITKIEIEILLFLQHNRSYDTARDIVELKSYTKSHVSKAIDSLIKNGYLIGKLDEHDRRSIHLEIPPRAQPIVQEALQLRNSLLDILFKNMSNEEKLFLDQIARKIDCNIKEALENEKIN